MYFQPVLQQLDKYDVQYSIVGGVAVNLHGILRFTADLDLVVELSIENLKKFLAAMKDAGYVPRLPVAPEDLLSEEKRREWMTEKNLKAFTFWNPKTTLEHVDMLLSQSENSGIYQRSIRRQAGGIHISFASIDDLIKMKQIAGRDKDQLDIADLNKLKRLNDEQQK